MSLSDLASIGSFVSGLAVLVSLVFLYFQLRQFGTQIKQAEKNQRAAMGQGRNNRMVELSLRAAEPGLNPALANVFSNSKDLTAHELFQFANYARALFLNAEDTYYQHSEGLLDGELFAGFVNAMKGSVSMPAWRMMWQYHRPVHGPSFVEFVDRLIEAAPLEPIVVPEERLAAWKVGISAFTARVGSIGATANS